MSDQSSQRAARRPEAKPRNSLTPRTRTRVERGIYKRHTSDARVRYEVAYLDERGKQRWRTVDRLQEARDLRAELVTKVREGEHVPPSKVTFASYADEWLRGQTRLRPTTRSLYATYLRLHLKPRLGPRRLQSITVDDIAALVAEMEKGVRYIERDGVHVATTGKPFAPWTIKGVLVVLGRILGSAVRARMIPANPVRLLTKEERPTVERREFPRLDLAAIGTLIASTPKRYRTLVAVSVLSGIRQSEALGLRWQDVDVRAGVLRIRFQLDRHAALVEPKTSAARRDVPIPPSLGKMLTAHKQEAFRHGHAKPTDYVFASTSGAPMNHRNIVRRGLEKALANSGLPHLKWHDLRHIAASALIAQGADVAYVSRVLGHASPAITLNIYAHAFAERDHAEETRDRMEAAFGKMLV